MANKCDKTILITGGCGFVGTYFVNHFSESNFYDKVLVCCHGKAPSEDSNRLLFVKADLLDSSTYQIIFEKYHPDDVIHLAAVTRFKQGEENPENCIRTNFFGTMELLRLARKFGVGRFLYVSSNMARNPKGVTGVSKYLVEAFIKTISKPPVVTSIRLPNVIDSPGAVTLVFKQQIEEGKPVTLTDKRMTRKFITPIQSAMDLDFVLNNGRHQDLFINNKPSTPIIDLAQQMIIESGRSIPIKFIGMRNGEKMEEEDYPVETISPTEDENIFRLTEDYFSYQDVMHAIGLLEGKVNPKTIDKIKVVFNQE